MTIEDEQLALQAGEDPGSQDDQASSDQDGAAGTASPSDEGAPDAQRKAKAPRDPLAEMGRTLSQRTVELNETRGLLQHVMGQVDTLIAERNQSLTNQQKLDHAHRMAAIADLPADQQVKQLWKVVDQLTAPKDPPKPAPAVQAETQDQIAAKIRAHLAKINSYYGLEGDNALTGNEDELDGHATEQQWFGSAKTLAILRQKQQQGGSQVPKQSKDDELETLRARVAELEGEPKARTVPGASKANNVPSAARKGPVTAEAVIEKMDRSLSGYKPKLGVKRVREQLEAQRDALREITKGEVHAIV